MRVENHSGDCVSVRVFGGDDSFMVAACDNGIIENGEGKDFNPKQASGKLKIYKRRVSQFDLNSWDFFQSPPPDATSDAIDNTHLTILNTVDGAIVVLDWTAIEARWRGQSLPQAEIGGEEMREATRVAVMVLDALSTTVSAMGPKGAAVAGVSKLLSLLLAGTLDEEEPPELLDIEGIQQAMVEVIEEANDKREARTSASLFLSTTQWLIDQVRHAHALTAGAQGTPPDSPVMTHTERDFREGIEKRVQHDEPFLIQLKFCQMHPEVAKFILPAFVSGLVANLQIQRFHDIMRDLDGETITREDIENFNHEVDHAIASLTSAKTALEAYAARKVASEKLTGTPQGVTMKEHVYERHTGSRTLDFVATALARLAALKLSISAEVEKTRKGGRADRYTGGRR